MGSSVADMEYSHIKLVFACKRLILMKNQSEVHQWFNVSEPAVAVWAVIVGLMNIKQGVLAGDGWGRGEVWYSQSTEIQYWFPTSDCSIFI